MTCKISGSRIRAIRSALGLTAAQLAGVLGVHPVTVHRWEGANTAKVDGLAGIAIASLDHLIDTGGASKFDAAKIGAEIAFCQASRGNLVALHRLVGALI